jgi:hypothetical protein
MVTVPTTGVEDPPRMVVGLTVKEVTVGALMFSAPVAVVVPNVAPIFATTLVLMPEVVTLNVADEDPAGIVTLAGTCAATLLELRVTTAPSEPAAPLRVTVACDP